MQLESDAKADIAGASVVICARNAAATIATQLHAVLTQEAEFPFELVVVDNGSTDGTGAIIGLAAELDARVVPVFEARAGVNIARNRGVASSHFDRVLLCDADDAVEPGWVQAMASALEGNVFAGGARIRGGLNTPAERDLLGITSLEPTIRCSTKLGVPTPGGANCAFRKEMWQEIGGFDESIGPTGGLDEEEFFARAHDAGWRMTEVPDGVIQYYVPAGTHESFLKGYRYGRNVEVVRARLPRRTAATASATPGYDSDADLRARRGRARARWTELAREAPRRLASRTGRSDWTRRVGSELGHLTGAIRVRVPR